MLVWLPYQWTSTVLFFLFTCSLVSILVFFYSCMGEIRNWEGGRTSVSLKSDIRDDIRTFSQYKEHAYWYKKILLDFSKNYYKNVYIIIKFLISAKRRYIGNRICYIIFWNCYINDIFYIKLKKLYIASVKDYIIWFFRHVILY